MVGKIQKQTIIRRIHRRPEAAESTATDSLHHVACSLEVSTTHGHSWDFQLMLIILILIRGQSGHANGHLGIGQCFLDRRSAHVSGHSASPGRDNVVIARCVISRDMATHFTRSVSADHWSLGHFHTLRPQTPAITLTTTRGPQWK